MRRTVSINGNAMGDVVVDEWTHDWENHRSAIVLNKSWAGQARGSVPHVLARKINGKIRNELPTSICKNRYC